MDFGSKFVYNYSDSDEEVVSEDEFEEGLVATKVDWDEQQHGHRAARVPAGVPPHPARPAGMATSRSYPSPSAAAPTCIMPMSMMSAGSVLQSSHIQVGGSSCGAPPPPMLQVIRPAKPKKVHHWQKSTMERQRSRSAEREVKGKKWRRADTNVLSVKFGQLTSASDMHTGDPFYCSSCTGVLSSLSKISGEDEEKVWSCEFCTEGNPVDLMEEEIPKKTDVTFMLKPAPFTASSGRSGVDESLVVFCVDMSGSMCVTTEVAGRIKLRGDHLDRLQSLNTERENQRLPSQRRDITYVSRLQGMQAAVDFQLSEMAKEHPDRKVALVTFNSEVNVIGDGTGNSVPFSGDKLSNMEDMRKAGEDIATPGPIKTTQKKLQDKLFDLEEGGQTALGPALLLSVALASQVSGSKVIICTDGMANVGLGSLDCGKNKTALESASTFYQEVAQLASDKGVSVSVCTIQGTDCKLAELGQVAANTGGQVNIVDLLKLTQEFGNILADSTVATNVHATLILHMGLYFRNEDQESNKLTRNIGNVTKDTEITFEYGIKRSHKKPKSEKEVAAPAGDEAGPSSAESTGTAKSAIDDLTELPFQLQLTYTDMEGGQAMRVITQTKPITRDRTEAEKEMNPVLLGVHGAQQSAQMAIGGAYTDARLNAFAYNRMMVRNMDTHDDVRDAYGCYLDNVAPVEHHLQQQQRSEVSTRGRTYSDDEDDDEDMEEEVPRVKKGFLGFGKGKAKKSVVRKRQGERSDAPANLLFAKSKASSSDWVKKE